MALPAAFLSEDQFTCSICLEVFTDPVSTACGHSFCQGCITSYWEGVGVGGARGPRTYLCPLCKESYRKRPELHVNRTLKEITEQYKMMVMTPGQGGGGGANAHLPGHGDMPGTLIAEMKSRFQQLSTDPQNHGSLRGNNTLTTSRAQSVDQQDPPPPSYPEHHSISPGDPGPSLCPVHLRTLEFFCRSDSSCLCSACVDSPEHRGHTVTAAKREYQVRKVQLGMEEVELKDQICQRERKVEEIQKYLLELQAAADRETAGTMLVFSRLISSVERCQAEVLESMALRHTAAQHKAQTLLRELDQEILELKMRSSALTELVTSDDHIDFLKTYSHLSTPPHTKDWSGVSVSSELTSGQILRTINPLIERLEEEMNKLPQLCHTSLMEQSVPRSNPKVRRVQEYAADITLDHYTAHPRLIISADGKQVQCGERHQQVPDNPERFDRVVCVLARQGFSSGRHYWEVEVGSKTDWDLGIASRSVHRKGRITVSPAHGYWFLSLRDQSDYAFRTEPSTGLTVRLKPSRIGIFVDFEKGLVSFYNVEARELLYTYTGSFPDAVRPFFSPCTNKSGRNEAPLIICPVSVTE